MFAVRSARRIAAAGVRRPSAGVPGAAGRRGLASEAEETRVVLIEDYKTYEQKIKEEEKAVIYWTASWCPPCRAIKPVYDALSKQHTGVSFLKVDVDQNDEAAAKAAISSIPAFHFFHKGRLLGKFVGADRARLQEEISILEEKP